jgi:hypothetical protein
MRSCKFFFAVVAALGGLAAAPSRANAAFLLDIEQDGGNVVGNGSGTINTSALSFLVSEPVPPFVSPSGGTAVLGPASPVSGNAWVTASGPNNFGAGSNAYASTGSGDLVGISGFSGEILLPLGYDSGAALSDSATWDGTTLSALGLIDGSYVYTWGTGPTADSFTVQIGPVAVPEPASAAVFGVPAALLLLLRRKGPRAPSHPERIAAGADSKPAKSRRSNSGRHSWHRSARGARIRSGSAAGGCPDQVRA